MKQQRKNSTEFYHNSFSYDHGHTRSQTHTAWNFEESIKSTLPVWPNFVNRTNFQPDSWVDHTNCIYTVVEVPLEGDMRFHQRDENTVVKPGEAYLIHQGENSRRTDRILPEDLDRALGQFASVDPDGHWSASFHKTQAGGSG